MIDPRQIHTALKRLFHEEGHRIVCWNDPEREFQNTLPFLNLDGVTTLRLDEVGALETKIRLERDEPDGKFLLYSPTAEPDDEDDWLLDIRLYSRGFQADRASILLHELGLAHQHLRTHLAERHKFFDAKDRLRKLKSLVASDDAAADLDLALGPVLPAPAVVVRHPLRRSDGGYCPIYSSWRFFYGCRVHAGYVSNCVETSGPALCRGVLALSIAFRIVNNLRRQAVRATLAGLPASRRRW